MPGGMAAVSQSTNKDSKKNQRDFCLFLLLFLTNCDCQEHAL